MNRNETIGREKQDRGHEKEGAGKALGDRSLQYEGAKERIEGSIQETYGKAQRKVGDLIDDLSDKIKD